MSNDNDDDEKDNSEGEKRLGVSFVVGRRPRLDGARRESEREMLKQLDMLFESVNRLEVADG